MAYTLTQRTKDALSRELIEPNLVLCIDGIADKFGVKVNKAVLFYDVPGATYDAGQFYDGIATDERTLDLISLTGTTTTISQQMEPDKAAASSSQSLTVTLIDRNNYVSQMITPGFIVDDIIYRNCRLFIGMQETSFPEDYIEVFNGKIQEVRPGAGTVDFIITHPEDLKKSSIFEKAESDLAQAALFDGAVIQGLTYVKQADVAGAVNITYTSSGLGDNAVVTVIGNSITVQIDPAFTTAKTVKKRIENSDDANQLVSVTVTGTPTQLQTTQALTTLTSSTEIFVNSVSNFLTETASPLFKTYIRINDEIIKYTAIDTVNNKFTGVTRSALTSFGESHKVGDKVSSFYVLGDATTDYGNAVDLALQVMISGGETYFVEETATRFNLIPSVGTVANSVYLPGIYLKRDYGVTVGDRASVSGTVSNNFVDKSISGVVEIDSGSYITVSGVTLINQTGASAALSVKSQYATLPDGVGVLPQQIDIDRFKSIKTTYSSSISNYKFYLKDTLNSKEFLNQNIFLPSALYSLPRKGRISLGIVAPPLYDINTKVLNLATVKNPKSLKLSRSVTKNFYNAVTYQYNPDSVEDKFLNKNISVAADSKLRIDSPAKVFKIEADGLRPSNETTVNINRNVKRFLNRYKFGAETIKVPVLFAVGFGIEIGDAVVFGDNAFYLPDSTNGTTQFTPRVMEVINKELNWKTGDISLTLLDSNYSADVRVGIFSPSSIAGVGSTPSQIRVIDSYGTFSPVIESDKWQNYIGRELLVHSEDWSVQQTTYLQGFDPGDPYLMNVAPPLAFSPTAGYIIDIPNYPDVDPLESFYKNVHVFWDPTLTVVSGASSTSFDVSVSDAAKLFVGSLIRVHNYAFTIDSGEGTIKVTNITGTTVTCEDLGFTPMVGMKVELVGFVDDNGKPYVWL